MNKEETIDDKILFHSQTTTITAVCLSLQLSGSSLR
jgi:hypothetical protein